MLTDENAYLLMKTQCIWHCINMWCQLRCNFVIKQLVQNKCIDQIYIKVNNGIIQDQIDKMSMNQPFANIFQVWKESGGMWSTCKIWKFLMPHYVNKFAQLPIQRKIIGSLYPLFIWGGKMVTITIFMVLLYPVLNYQDMNHRTIWIEK